MNIEQLRKKLDDLVGEISLTFKEFPWEDKECYAMWLRQTYSFVCHSTRLLTLSSALCKEDSFHYRFMDHAVEEKAHELLLERDFKSLGSHHSDYPELASTTGIYQIQYYWIQHVSPLCLFGYILLLESLAVQVGGELYEQTKKHFGDQASNFLRVHVEEDEWHLPKAFKALEKASPEDIKAIDRALFLTSHFYHKSMKDILEYRHSSIKEIAA